METLESRSDLRQETSGEGPSRDQQAPAGRDRDDPDLVALMTMYQDGRIEAFEGLFEALSPHLRRYLISLCRNSERAKDLLQETFLQMHRSRHTYIPRSCSDLLDVGLV